jgi:peptidoglycan hydrolase CwlO-like protein
VVGVQHKRGKTGLIGGMDPHARANEDLINFLEHKLEEIEKKLQKTQHEYESLQSDYMDMKEKMNMSREKYKRAALLMTEFLDDLLT